MNACDSKPDWLASNWKWLLPAGCLGVVAILVAFVAGTFAIVAGSMKSSGAYAQAMDLAAADPAVLRELGEPIEAGWFVGGSLHVSGPSGEAELSIPLRGPAGRGTLHVVATKSAGRWSLQVAEVELAGRSRRIDLLREIRDQVFLQLPSRTAAPLARAWGLHAGRDIAATRRRA